MSNSDRGYKVVETMQYTETVYYDADGNEMARVRNNDDTLYDQDVFLTLTDREVEDYC